MRDANIEIHNNFRLRKAMRDTGAAAEASTSNATAALDDSSAALDTDFDREESPAPAASGSGDDKQPHELVCTALLLK